jgi:hypothetical protein
MIPSKPAPAGPRPAWIDRMIMVVFMVCFGSIAVEIATVFGAASLIVQAGAAAIGAALGLVAARAFGPTLVRTLRR